MPMPPSRQDPAQRSEFIAHLRDEKIRAQQMRGEYTMRKLAFVTALLGLGSINLGGSGPDGLDLTSLLFLVPWVSIAFDLYIMGEDFGIKRIGMFLRGITQDPLEMEWERWVAKKRDWFAPLAMPLLTNLLLFGAALILIWRGTIVRGFAVWFVGTFIVTWLVYGLFMTRRKAVDQAVLPAPAWMSQADGRPATALSAAWQEVRGEAKAAGYTLTRDLFERIREVFVEEYASGRETPAGVTREYHKKEFLLVLDEHGQPGRLPEEVLARCQQAVEQHPAFAEWFQPCVLPRSGKAGLLTARWLCHLVGLLHGTVEIFLDPVDPAGAIDSQSVLAVPDLQDPAGAHLAGFTLVQVRGMDKVEAPAAFDIPCAGHISGVEDAEAALRKELAEELGLSFDDLYGIRLITRYNSIHDAGESGLVNNEHRILYRAKVSSKAAARIRFADGEVAGLGIMNVAELRLLVRRYPERVASGLSDAMKYYE